MNQIVKLSIILGLSVGIQPAIANSQPTNNQPSATANRMSELSTKWGFEVTDCQSENIAEIEHDRTGDVACVVPNEKIGTGKYIYDSTDNKILQVATEASNTPEVVNSNESTNTATATQKPVAEKITFNFDNSYDYGVCLDAVLLAYEQREAELANMSKNECANNILSTYGQNLSQDTALEIIKAANNYATNVLEDKLYPSLGLRRRIAIALGYVYDLDRNNSDIIKYLDNNK